MHFKGGEREGGSSKLLNKKVSPGKILTEQTDRVNGLAARGLPFGQEAVPGKVLLLLSLHHQPPLGSSTFRSDGLVKWGFMGRQDCFCYLVEITKRIL